MKEPPTVYLDFESFQSKLCDWGQIGRQRRAVVLSSNDTKTQYFVVSHCYYCGPEFQTTGEQTGQKGKKERGRDFGGHRIEFPSPGH